MYHNKRDYRKYIEDKQLKGCDDCKEFISDFETNHLKIKERKCRLCVMYWASDLPCDTCDDGIAHWFYWVESLGKRGICQKCYDKREMK